MAEIITDTFIKDALLPRVEQAFENKNNIKTLILAIQKYADKHSDILLSNDMSKRLIFADSDKNILYTVTGISEADVKNAVKNAPSVKSTWTKSNNPFYVISMVIMSYFYGKKDKESLAFGNAVAVYLGYLLYTTNHKATWKYLPSKEVMDYTMANLSNRYLIIQLGTIQACIEHIIIEAMSGRFKDDIVRGYDTDYSGIISSLDTRISSFINNIGDAWYDNYKNGKYLYHEEGSEDPDDYHPEDNRTYKIDRLTKQVLSSIITNGFDEKTIIKKAIQINPSVSDTKLSAMLRIIVKEDAKNIETLISSILTLFVYKGTTNTLDDVKTMKFISESMQIYKSNAQDDITYKIKDILLSWIELASKNYGRNYISRGKTSLDNYRKALYTSFVFKIYECAKGGQ